MSSLVSITLDNDALNDVEDFVNLNLAPSPPPGLVSALEERANAPEALVVVASEDDEQLKATLAAATLMLHTKHHDNDNDNDDDNVTVQSAVSCVTGETLLAKVTSVVLSVQQNSNNGTTVSPNNSLNDASALFSAPTSSTSTNSAVSSSFTDRGLLYVSNYRLRFQGSRGIWQLHISNVANVEKVGGPGMQSSAWFGAAAPCDLASAIIVHSRDPRPPVRFEFEDDADALSRCGVFDLLVALAFPHSLRDSFALQRRSNVRNLDAEYDAAQYSYDADLDSDLARMGIRDAPCSCQRAASLLDQSPPAAPSPAPSPPPAFSRFVQGLFATDLNASETVSASPQPPTPPPPGELVALRVEEAMSEARRLFPRCLRCSGWRVSRVNHGGGVCPTYPERLIVPAALCDNDIAVATHRASQRLVVLGYRHAASGGVIMRASQPRSGLGGHRQRADELLVAAARRACPRADEPHDGPQLLIIDARPTANAMANMALGGGYESTLHYVHCALSFLGIANIHAVKTNLARLVAACGDDAAPDCARVTLVAGPWLEQLRRILEGAQVAAQHVGAGGAVLLHCSDGWDRTPQVLILARLLLDSSVRTARGLCMLLRTQWLALGHKSSERLGLGERAGGKEQSPVLLQLLECVWNVWQQHPSAFEFTPKLLALLLHYSTSFRFASFYGNNERERAALGVRRGACLWRYLLSGEAEREHGSWANPLYEASLSNSAPLRLAFGSCDVQLWTALHRRGVDSAFGSAQHTDALWSELPLTFDSEGALIARVRALVRSRDDF